jgi:hypothetical protein
MDYSSKISALFTKSSSDFLKLFESSFGPLPGSLKGFDPYAYGNFYSYGTVTELAYVSVAVMQDIHKAVVGINKQLTDPEISGRLDDRYDWFVMEFRCLVRSRIKGLYDAICSSCLEYGLSPDEVFEKHVYVSGMGMISCSMFLEQFEGMTIGFD